MEPHKIESILEKYFEGESTLKDEKILFEYFNGANIASHLNIYKPLFQFVANEKMQQSKTQISKNIPQKKSKRWLSIAAAVCVFTFGILWMYDAQVDSIPSDGAIEDPELAFEETKKALMLVSENLNKGMNKTEYLSEFNKSKNLIFKNQ